MTSASTLYTSLMVLAVSTSAAVPSAYMLPFWNIMILSENFAAMFRSWQITRTMMPF